MLTSLDKDILKKLLEKNIISAEQSANLEKEESLAKAIIGNKILSEEAFTELKGEILGIPYIDLEGKKMNIEVLNLMKKNIAKNYKMLIFEKVDKKLKVAMVDPRNFRAAEAIKFLAQKNGLGIEKYIISESGFKKNVNQYDVLGTEVEKVLDVAKEKLEKVEEEIKDVEEKEEMEEIIKKAPVSKMVSLILKHAVDRGASDIHIEPAAVKSQTRIRYRVDGVLKTALVLPIYVHASVVSRIKVLANLKIDETRIPQDGRIREIVNEKQIDFRISILPLRDHEKVVMRILDTSKGIPTIEQLGFRKRYKKIIERNIAKPNGLLLITGPTGSGKSTTLYTVLSMLNTEGINISTLEDPVEYQVAGVNQSQMHSEIGFTFAAGLRALLRQDPDVIMVGEIRDTETGELAIHAALTGHVVFSTLHTNDAFGVVPRMIDMHIEAFLIASTLNLMLAQRLVRKICDNCKEEATIPSNVEREIKELVEKIPESYFKESEFGIDKNKPLKVYQGKGCAMCGETGYKGRSAVAEMLENSTNLRKIISTGCKFEELTEEAKVQEMITLKQDAILKALEGITTIEEVLRVTKD